MKPILILGLGNQLQGDDGVGCRVAQELEKVGASVTAPIASVAAHLPDNVEVIDGGTPGVGLLNLFEGRRRVIIIDAAEMGLEPGEFKRFKPSDVILTGAAQRFSLHRTGVADAFALARELKLTLPEIVFFGVQPARVDWSDQLSPSVRAALPRVVDAVMKEVIQ